MTYSSFHRPYSNVQHEANNLIDYVFEELQFEHSHFRDEEILNQFLHNVCQDDHQKES